MNRHEDNENEVERASKKIFRDEPLMGIKDEYFDDTYTRESVFKSSPKDILPTDISFNSRPSETGIAIYELRTGDIHAGTGLRCVEVASLNPYLKNIELLGKQLASAFNRYDKMVELLRIAEKEMRLAAPEKSGLIDKFLRSLGDE